MTRWLIALAFLLGGLAPAATPAEAQTSPAGRAATAARATTPAAQRPAPQGPTLRAVRARGHVLCGVYGTVLGFSQPDAQGNMQGLNADFCRAIAAAALGDASKVRFINMATPDEGLAALAARRVDVLLRNVTITFARDLNNAINPAGVLYYDGQGFLVNRASGIGSARQLDGKKVCVATGGGVQAGVLLERFAERNGIRITAVPAADSAAAFAAFKTNNCDAVTGDAGTLASRRVTELARPDDAILLPERISREPLGPWVHASDDAWRQLVFWTLQVLMVADEAGLSSQNIAGMVQVADPELRMLLGVEGAIGAPFGLANDWALNVIRHVGNYGEIYDRTLGSASRVGLDRGLNDAWTRGGLQYPMVLR